MRSAAASTGSALTFETDRSISNREVPLRGVLLRRFGSPGAAAGQFNLPDSVCLLPTASSDCDSDGRTYARRERQLLVLDSGNNRVQAFSPNGRFLYEFASGGSALGQLDAASGMCLVPLAPPAASASSPCAAVKSMTTVAVAVADSMNNRLAFFARNPAWAPDRDSSCQPPTSPSGTAAAAAAATHSPASVSRGSSVPQPRDRSAPLRMLAAVVGRDVSRIVAAYVAPGTVQVATAVPTPAPAPSLAAATAAAPRERPAEPETGVGGAVSAGSGAEQFDTPSGVTLSRGELLVCDTRNCRVQVLSVSAAPSGSGELSARFVRAWHVQPDLDVEGDGVVVDSFEPVAVAVAHGTSPADDEVFLTFTVHDGVYVFRRDGRFVRAFGAYSEPGIEQTTRGLRSVTPAPAHGEGEGEPGAGHESLTGVGGLLVNGDTLLVADTTQHRVSVLERATGHWLRDLPLPDDGEPVGLALDADAGELYVSDQRNHCVHVFG